MYSQNDEDVYSYASSIIAETKMHFIRRYNSCSESVGHSTKVRNSKAFLFALSWHWSIGQQF